MGTFRRILVATDFGESSERAQEVAADLAQRCSAELIVVHAVEDLVTPYPIMLMPEPAKVDAHAQMGVLAVVDKLKAAVPNVRSELLRGSAADQILSFVEKNAVDLVVVGSHGRKGPSRWLMGSVAEKIVRSCRAAVLTVRQLPADP